MNPDASLPRLRREPPAFRRVQVRAISPLSARMLRVVLGGDELDGFALEAPASSVRLLLPSPGHDAIEMPSWTGSGAATAHVSVRGPWANTSARHRPGLLETGPLGDVTNHLVSGVVREPDRA